MSHLESRKLNRRLLIQSRQVVDDPIYGPQPADWATVATVWAEVQDALPSKSEAVVEGAVVSYNRTRIRIRYRKGIDATLRIVEQGGLGRVWHIVGGPAILGNREGIEVLCEEYSTEELDND